MRSKIASCLLAAGVMVGCMGSDTNGSPVLDAGRSDATATCGGSGEPCCNASCKGCCLPGLTCRVGTCTPSSPADTGLGDVVDAGDAGDAGDAAERD